MRALALLDTLPATDLARQFHPDLSPLGWHFGHSATVEAYWLHEVVLHRPIAPAWKELYFPEFSSKTQRGARLPVRAELAAFCRARYAEHDALLDAWETQAPPHALLANDYLLHFLIQHHAQHYEIMQQILTQRALATPHTFRVTDPLVAQAPIEDTVEIAGGEARIGDDGAVECYDNELRCHAVALKPYALAKRAVTNAQYLGFIEARGYEQAAHWSPAAWAWLHARPCRAPDAWRQDPAGHWYTVGVDGAQALIPDAPVNGISWYEAAAFAHYAGARLPHETEWEHARALRAFAWDAIGAWEWCANAFYPYPGFRAFPYDGYSTPWFDGDHYVLRGAGIYTDECIKRRTFRNFYAPDKRHIFAGLRLAYTP